MNSFLLHLYVSRPQPSQDSGRLTLQKYSKSGYELPLHEEKKDSTARKNHSAARTPSSPLRPDTAANLPAPALLFKQNKPVKGILPL